MKKVEIKKLKEGDEFYLSEFDPKIYIMEKYSKNLKRYVCYNKSDLSDVETIKKNTKVWVNQ